MTIASSIVTDIDNFVALQNANRGGPLAGGGPLPLDYNALSSSAVVGENAVTGISGIAAGAAMISLPSVQIGNAVIIDGALSPTASTNGVDSYSFVVSTTGIVTVTDNNTGYSEPITGATYLVFDGAATTSTGAFQQSYIIASGTNAEIAEMYNSALGREPDFAGLEFYAIPTVSGTLSLHQDAVYFLASPEFAKLYPALTAPADNGGTNDRAFITELYGNILHRTPSAAEVQYYVDALQGTLTTSAGTAIPACDRAQLLTYFSISPENQADVSASNGGWLINPANGTTSLGAVTQATTNAILASDVASGTVNANDFSSVASGASQYSVTNAQGGVTVIGGASTVGGLAVAGAAISATDPNITIDLTSTINIAYAAGQGDVVNGAGNGGSTVYVASSAGIGSTANNLVTVNLAGNGNIMVFGLIANSGVAVASVIHGWNSTDVVSYTSGTATAAMVNVGVLYNTSPAGAIAAAGLTGAGGQNGFIEAQDSSSDTFVYHWHTTSAGQITASSIDGAVELVGVPASNLTAANFH